MCLLEINLTRSISLVFINSTNFKYVFLYKLNDLVRSELTMHLCFTKMTLHQK